MIFSLLTKRLAISTPLSRINMASAPARSYIRQISGLRPPALPVNTMIKFVPQQEAWTVERFGKFHRILEPGLRVLFPVIDTIKYVNSLKEVAIEIPSQSAITQDNVSLQIDGVLYVRVVDAYKASYGVENPEFAVTQLAQTTMRAEIGQMSLDKTLAERQLLNANIVNAINSAAIQWGIQCLRYEIRDIHPPESVIQAMHSQVSADRRKRAEILASEGERQANINVAEGQKQATILKAEAERLQVVNKAKGNADAILLAADAQAQAIQTISSAIGDSPQSHEAIRLTVAEKYIEALKSIAKESTTVLMDTNKSQNGLSSGLGGIGDASGMVASALSVYDSVARNKSKNRLEDSSQLSKSKPEDSDKKIPPSKTSNSDIFPL